MNLEVESTLRILGLTEGEIKVYLSLIELGSVTVGPIIDKARVSSSKVYMILEKLIQKGLVTYITKEKTKYFQAAQPISLMDYAELKEKQVRQTKESLKNVISQIENIQTEKNYAEEARIYKGYDGIKTALFEAIKTIPNGKEYCFFSTGYGNDPYLQRLFKKLALELKSRRIKIKGIGGIEEKELYETYYKKLGYSMKYKKHFWPSDITIAGDYLLIFVWQKKEPTIYSLHSAALVRSYSDFFNKNWND